MKKLVIFLIVALFSLQRAAAIEQLNKNNHMLWNSGEQYALTNSNTKYSFLDSPKGGFCLRPGIGNRLSFTTYYGSGKNFQPFFDMGMNLSGFTSIGNLSPESISTFFNSLTLNSIDAMIGGRMRLGGEKFAFSIYFAMGCATYDFSQASFVVNIGPMLELFSFDIKLGLQMYHGGNIVDHQKQFGYVNIGYNIKSKKYKQTIASEQERSWQYTPYYPTPDYPTSPRNIPCSSHIKSGIYYESSLKERINKENDGIVGIYESANSSGYKLGVIKYNNTYRVIYMSGGSNKCWEFGHVKAELRPSATTGLFKATWYMADFSENDDCIIAFDGVKMTVMLPAGNTTYIKMYPQQSRSNISTNEPQNWSGSGWALDSEYLVTNYHVIDGARTISVKGIGGDLNSSYSADVVATDKTNDIAVLKIKDSRFNGFGAIPYAVSSRIADKGEGIFVLGYPMTQVLGNEVKYTAGEINSRTGFQGDVATYQISAPVTHGNSGGPMFDNKGNVIGIVNSGITDKEIAENVGYAIKISYLKILIESAGLNITLPSNNTISTLSKQEKIKKVEKFVYYIECSK